MSVHSFRLYAPRTTQSAPSKSHDGDIYDGRVRDQKQRGSMTCSKIIVHPTYSRPLPGYLSLLRTQFGEILEFFH